MATRDKAAPKIPIRVGSVWFDMAVTFVKAPRNREVRVMAIVENWVMVRYPGAEPFLIAEKSFLKRFALKATQ